MITRGLVSRSLIWFGLAVVVAVCVFHLVTRAAHADSVVAKVIGIAAALCVLAGLGIAKSKP